MLPMLKGVVKVNTVRSFVFFLFFSVWSFCCHEERRLTPM